MSRKKLLIISGAAVAALVAGLVAFFGTSASAAPIGAPVQSDYSTCTATVDAGGYVTCPLTDPVDLKGGDVKVFGTIDSPTGGLVNLPNSLRRVRLILDDLSSSRVTAVQWRVFGHQLRLDPNGNYRQNVYSGPITLDQKVTAGGETYCAGNACS